MNRELENKNIGGVSVNQTEVMNVIQATKIEGIKRSQEKYPFFKITYYQRICMQI